MDRPLTEIVAEMRARAAEATPGPWFTTGRPWFRTGSGVLAGSPDPHVAFMVADCETFEGEREEYIESDGRVKIASGDADAAHIAASCPSNVIALADGFDERGREIERLRQDAQSWAYAAHSQQFPKIVEPDRLAILDAVEEWVNRARDGETTVTEIGAAILQAAENAGWIREPDEAMKAAEARATAAEARVKELEDALRSFAKVAQHWRSEAYMRDDAECLIAWASDVSARLVTGMAGHLPRIKFEAFRTAARLLSGGADA